MNMFNPSHSIVIRAERARQLVCTSLGHPSRSRAARRRRYVIVTIAADCLTQCGMKASSGRENREDNARRALSSLELLLLRMLLVVNALTVFIQ